MHCKQLHLCIFSFRTRRFVIAGKHTVRRHTPRQGTQSHRLIPAGHVHRHISIFRDVHILAIQSHQLKWVLFSSRWYSSKSQTLPWLVLQLRTDQVQICIRRPLNLRKFCHIQNPLNNNGNYDIKLERTRSYKFAYDKHHITTETVNKRYPNLTRLCLCLLPSDW